MSELKKVTHTFIQGKISTCIIIPIDVARRKGIDKPSNVTGEEFEVNNIFNPDDLVLSHVTEEDFGHFLHTLLKRNFKDHHFYSHLF